MSLDNDYFLARGIMYDQTRKLRIQERKEFENSIIYRIFDKTRNYLKIFFRK